MATKKPTATRVFQLAKKLGVTSKDIVAKCDAEEIPGITNHMSTVSRGLEATIEEWFAAGNVAVATAVETADPVDVVEARAKATKATRKSRRTKATDDETETVAEAEEVVEQSKSVAVAPTMPRMQETTPVVESSAAAELNGDVQATAKAKPAAEAPAVVESEVDEESSSAAVRSPEMNAPERPKDIKPAGPQLNQPQKTQLAGPRVIRVEAPEVIQAPRRGPRGGAGVRTPGGPSGPGRAPSSPDDGGRGRTAAGPGSSRRNKRRTATGREDESRTARPAPATPGAARPFNWREQDLLEREERLNRSGGYFRTHRRDTLKRAAPGHRAMSAAESGEKIKIEVPISVKNLAASAGVKQSELLKKLLLGGNPSTVNTMLDGEAALTIMAEFGIDLDLVEAKTAEEQLAEEFSERDVVDLQPRTPVVTILGHVDHGKTTLLDKIRNANVASGEAGGITQATSAFRVPVKVGDGERTVTFIDTPGHEAFTAMRARGAKVTDIVVLVVAADDGVMPQTIESINHAKAAKVPIVVALNKIDKAEATDGNIQRILGQLAEHELNPVEWGGTTEVVRISAVKGEGIQDILETLDYQAQLLNLQADFGGAAQGSVLESQLEEGRGPVARVLVQQGTLRKGDVIVVGHAYGRVRDLVNDRGERIEEAGPSVPIALSGISDIASAGDKFYVVKNMREAESAAAERLLHQRQRGLTKEKVTLDNIFERLSATGRKELPLIVKADVNGSIETLNATLVKIANAEVQVSIKHAAVGPINESDISLAEASSAIVVGFNVSATPQARRIAEDHGIDIRYYDVIYDLIDDVTKAAEGLLDPEVRLEVLGHADVRDVFKISKVGMVAGCYVTDGVIERNSQIRVTRGGVVIEKDRRLEQLKRFKDDAKEVRAGQECGMKIVGYDDIKVGDVLECYKTKEVKRTL